MNGHETRQTMVLYETRPLLRSPAREIFENLGFSVADVSACLSVEEAIGYSESPYCFAVGISSAGKNVVTVMQVLHYLNQCRLPALVWLAEQDLPLVPLLLSLGVKHIYAETELYDELPLFNLHVPCMAKQLTPQSDSLNYGTLTKRELDILIYMSRGLTFGCISRNYGISYKTVYNYRHSISTRLNLDRLAWFKMISRLIQIHNSEG